MKEMPSIENLIEAFARLPGVGRRSAERMAYKILEMDEKDVSFFAESLSKAKSDIDICPVCGMYREGGHCAIDEDDSRNRKQIMVVSAYRDALAIENSNTYHGLYHVLGGTLSPSKGVNPEDLRIDSLVDRIRSGGIEEVIIGTNPTMDGETTSLYVAKILEPLGVQVTRLAYGLAIGSSLEYSDPLTLGKALEGRKKL